MEIYTLILSGNAEKSISFIGSIYALYNKNIIKNKFKNIKEIVCVSGGALVITFILIFIFNNLNFKQIIKLNLELDVDEILDLNEDAYIELCKFIKVKPLMNWRDYINEYKDYVKIGRTL